MSKRRRFNTGLPGLSFSLKRALGISRMRYRFARKTGIPTTRSGLYRAARSGVQWSGSWASDEVIGDRKGQISTFGLCHDRSGNLPYPPSVTYFLGHCAALED